MAKLSMHPNEPEKLITLIETLFPGVDLAPIHSMLKDTVLAGNIEVTKKLSDGSTISLILDIA